MYAQPQEPVVPPGLSSFGEWFGETFRLYGARWQVYVGQGLVLFLVNGLLALILAIMAMAATFSAIAAGNAASVDSDETIQALQMMSYVAQIVGGVLSALLIPGMVNTTLKQLRGEDISVGDVFSGARYFWGTLLVMLCTFLGLCGCLVGVVIVGTLLSLALPIMVDREMPVTKAMGLSWEVCKRNFWFFLLYGAVLGILAQSGGVACGIGVIATMAFATIGSAVAYYRIFYPLGYAMPGQTAMPSYIPPPYAGPGAPPPMPAAPAGPLPDGTAACARCGAVMPAEMDRCARCGEPRLPGGSLV